LTIVPTSPHPAPGQVLLYRKFVGARHSPKDKYIYILGNTSDGYTLFFLLSSQDYSQTTLARETVEIPLGMCSGLPKHCWIQCFHCVESRPTIDICSGLHFGQILDKGVLLPSILKAVRDVVSKSFVLQLREINEILALIPE
jgi:hypothetical protein